MRRRRPFRINRVSSTFRRRRGSGRREEVVKVVLPLEVTAAPDP